MSPARTSDRRNSFRNLRGAEVSHPGMSKVTITNLSSAASSD